LREQTYRQFTQELRFSGDITDTVDFVAGGFYFNSRYTLDQSTFLGPALGNVQGGNLVDHYSKSTALFADVQWKLSDALRLSVGGRYTWDEKNFTNDLSKLDNPSVVAVVGENWSKFTPRASIDYTFGETSNNLIYASFAQGYRAGGLNGRAQTLNAALTPYDPETVDSFELGFKTQFWDNRITFNVAGFLTKFKDKQEEVVVAAPPPINQETVVQNAAEATIKGIEAEFRARITDEFSLNGALGILDASYDSFDTLVNGVVTDISGRDLRRTPDLTAAIGGDYVVKIGAGELGLSASFRHVSSLQTTIVGSPENPNRNDPRGLASARNLVDASASYTFDLGGAQLRAAIFGRNLTDDRGLSSTLPVAGLFTFSAARPPRTWGIELGIEF
ncbi:MAG: TonB-dependent receptor, partial [Sandaracinobacteroides sp.]